jgi:hypothetical protein
MNIATNKSFANPSQEVRQVAKDSIQNTPAYHFLGKSFAILRKAFAKDFSRRKSIYNTRIHTHSLSKFKSFARYPLAPFCVCEGGCEGFIAKDLICPLFYFYKRNCAMNASCSNCQFFFLETNRHARSECRRRPPEARRSDRGHHDSFAIGIWPRVSPDGWCGEFTPRFRVLCRQRDAVGAKAT